MIKLQKITILLFLTFLVSKISGQNNECFGVKKELKLGTTTPYVKVKVGDLEGYYLLDFGTTGSTIDTNNFINGKPNLAANSTNRFDNFDFFGSWGTVTLNVQDHCCITGLVNFKQAGIIGTDFLSLNVFTIDYTSKLIYRADNNNFCSDSLLNKLGFKAASTAGYYSNDLNKLNNACTPNVPTIPIRIGKINAIAQIDPGFDDSKYKHSININEAYYRALVEAGVKLIENPSANLTLSTCIPNVTESVIAYRLPKETTFSIIGTDGNQMLVSSDANIFVKRTPLTAKNCGGIGTWQIPAGQIGASFLFESKKVIFDPFKSKVWFFIN